MNLWSLNQLASPWITHETMLRLRPFWFTYFFFFFFNILFLLLLCFWYPSVVHLGLFISTWGCSVFVWLVSCASGAAGFANQSHGHGGYGGNEGSYENPTGYGFIGSGPNNNIGGEGLQNEKILFSIKRFIKKTSLEIIVYLDTLDNHSNDFGWHAVVAYTNWDIWAINIVQCSCGSHSCNIYSTTLIPFFCTHHWQFPPHNFTTFSSY